ncbi:undecaprenyl-phosphate glucose phosphotransferase [Mucilaginibacter terrae]|uniref:Colanic acid biosynthesis UDP-glucose lipid carrier transferase n=1 Tax=Mucilaginibacter terrae TaxID=1955052 RepID=A0ABU3GQE4_9SPHI|nr:undecaprenyl-phosphate glucose phosphotransferase [Mucilaginibacter terrae]MDT3401756.1 putative colanic acid biosynthesis UDP-glucose lipid carrier transferase [Mucilaginibacter terrae]
MSHRYATFIKAINLSVDYVILNVSMILAYIIVDKSYIIWINNKNYLPIVLVFNLIWLLSANITRFYEQVLNKDSIKTFRGVFKTYLLFVSLICFTVLIIIGTKAYSITRQYLFYALALFGFLIGIWKLVFLAIRRSDRAMLTDFRQAVIVGGGRIGNDLYNFIIHNPERGYKILGFFEDNVNGIKPDLYLGGVDECIQYVKDNRVDEIFCTLPNTEAEKIERLMMDADKNLIRFKLIPEFYYTHKPTFVQNFGHIPVISIRPEPLENMLNRFFKRLFDIVFSIFVIVFIFSWLMPILAIIIKVTSPGSVFFVQRRSGRDNESFNCYKFRSMQVNKDSDSKQATRGDARITKIGAFMRKTNLDELPQFFNVLLGNMTVVGPRPHMLKHTEEYSHLIDQFMVRHFLKPGITGWAQVNGLRGETKTTEDMLQRVEADVWYLENWSFLLDLKIIFLTFYGTVKGDKNAF